MTTDRIETMDVNINKLRAALPFQPPEGLPLYRTYDTVRRAIDVTVALAGLLLWAPLMALIAIAIKLDSAGPVFYTQARVGHNRRRQQSAMRWLRNVIRLDLRRRDEHGQVFYMVKFRTMLADAEALTGAVWAQENDPRVTRVGRFLRRSRLDEIPQLWTVLRGEMSLIGPRPHGRSLCGSSRFPSRATPIGIGSSPASPACRRSGRATTATSTMCAASWPTTSSTSTSARSPWTCGSASARSA